MSIALCHRIQLVLLLACLLPAAGCPPVPTDEILEIEPTQEVPEDPGTVPGDAPALEPDTPSAAPPAFEAFDFAVETGAFWEFAWLKKTSSYDSHGAGTSTDDGTFRVVLGSQRDIDGVTLYEVTVEGEADQFAPRWRYIGLTDYQIYGSTDGLQLAVLFDGQRGVWPGSGFFFEFDSETLMTAAERDLDNDYITGRVIAVQRSTSAGECEYFSGVGTICPSATRESSSTREYYHPSLGPVGFYRYGSFSSTYGGASTETNGWLTAHSFLGTEEPQSREIEPNDSPAQAQEIDTGTRVAADIQGTDPGFDLADNPTTVTSAEDIGIPELADARLADWFTFALESEQDVYVTLEFPAEQACDLDLLLTDELGVFLGWSLLDNVALDSQVEGFEVRLGAGRYYVGIWAFDAPSRIFYSLHIE